MKETDNVISALEAVASNPKVASATIGSVFAANLAANLGVIQGWLSVISMSIATLTALVVLVYHVIKTLRLWREWQDDDKEQK